MALLCTLNRPRHDGTPSLRSRPPPGAPRLMHRDRDISGSSTWEPWAKPRGAGRSETVCGPCEGWLWWPGRGFAGRVVKQRSRQAGGVELIREISVRFFARETFEIILHSDALAQRLVHLQRESAAQQELSLQGQGQIAARIPCRSLAHQIAAVVCGFQIQLERQLAE